MKNIYCIKGNLVKLTICEKYNSYGVLMGETNSRPNTHPHTLTRTINAAVHPLTHSLPRNEQRNLQIKPV